VLFPPPPSKNLGEKSYFPSKNGLQLQVSRRAGRSKLSFILFEKKNQNPFLIVNQCIEKILPEKTA
jgi:hypothetical protein